eukprot:CAMPEP_0114424926 /NCGR_PEP_ID=MMETSP0103-20121206/6956_1 /TAXON_ID=37642 ORGANISM="Paraphysomonas imperforata, Strain PA2" /NCGR_SAMPLE_ID=MMETSP0103 /ASSEMBLY_ACC=CAM_ASM_000201 /LENGTH=305 /DNA_ID=CAMNT_0001593715 /DNA_START=25 /DNA_END=938 /DNA_ORIENTATION=+
MSEEDPSTTTPSPYETTAPVTTGTGDESNSGQGGNYGSGYGSGAGTGSDSLNSNDRSPYSSAPPPSNRDSTENKIFIGGLSWQTTLDGLRFYFEKFGELTDVALMTDKHTGQPRGFGFITMADAAAADVVLGQSHNIDGRVVDCKRAVPKDKAPAPTRLESTKIFVGGLSPDVGDKEFKECFEKYGAITDSIVMFDRKTNRSRGFGFVTFENEESVRTVLSRDHEIMGKYVEIKRAEPRDSSNLRGGPGMDGGGRGAYSSRGGGYNDGYDMGGKGGYGGGGYGGGGYGGGGSYGGGGYGGGGGRG